VQLVVLVDQRCSQVEPYSVGKEDVRLAGPHDEVSHLRLFNLSQVSPQEVRYQLRNVEFKVASQLDLLLLADSPLFGHLVELRIDPDAFEVARGGWRPLEQLNHRIDCLRVLCVLPFLQMLLQDVRRHREHPLLLVTCTTAKQVIQKPADGPKEAGKEVVNIGAAARGSDSRRIKVLVAVLGLLVAHRLDRSLHSLLFACLLDGLREDVVDAELVIEMLG